jgi:hypothetical protein
LESSDRGTAPRVGQRCQERRDLIHHHWCHQEPGEQRVAGLEDVVEIGEQGPLKQRFQFGDRKTLELGVRVAVVIDELPQG